MKDIIVVAGGDSKRTLELANKFDNEKYHIKICQSSEDFRTAISDDKVISALLLYPDEHGIVSAIFDCNIINKYDYAALVIFISLSPGDNNYLRSLRYEADEFLIEPISAHEIVQIIDSLPTRRNDRRKILAIGDLAWDRTSLTVTLRSAKLRLHPIQVRILEFLMLNPGRAFTRQKIANSIWGADDSIDERTIDVTIGRIRDALKHKVTVDPIRTVRSVGYAFNEYFGQISSVPKKGRRAERLRPGRVVDRVRSTCD